MLAAPKDTGDPTLPQGGAGITDPRMIDPGLESPPRSGILHGMLSTILIVVLAGSGALIAAYVALVTIGAIPPDAAWVPRVCRMEESACAVIVHHPDAALFGIPNAFLALALYAGVLAAALAPGNAVVLEGVRVALWGSVAAGAYLTYSLLVRLKVFCPLCLAAHAVNLSLAILLSLRGTEIS